MTLTTHVSVQLITAAFPLYAVQVGADDALLGLMAGIIAFMSLVNRPLAGVWIDRRGGQPALLAGIVLYVLVTAGYLFAPSVGALMGLRALTGVSVALFATAGQSLAISLTPRQQWGAAVSLYSVAYPIAQIVGPPSGVAIARGMGYRPLFALCTAVAALAALMASRLTNVAPAGTPRRGRWLHRGVAGPGLLLLLLNVAFGANYALLAVHASRHGIDNPGVVFTAQAATALIVLLLMSRMSERVSRRALVAVGLGVSALGMWTTAFAAGWPLLLAAVLSGAGHGIGQTGLHIIAAGQVSFEERGRAMATLGVLFEAGVVLGAVGGGFVAQALGTPAMFALAGVCPAVGMVWAVIGARSAAASWDSPNPVGHHPES